MRTSLLVGALLLIGVAGFAQDTRFDTEVDMRMGRRVFRSECGRCHGRDGKGNDETGAPDLTTGSLSVRSDAALFDVVRDGVPGTTMVGISWAPDTTVQQVVAYVRSLNIDPGDYDLPGSVDNGEQIFFDKGNCVGCHMVDGTGGRLGPDLSSVAYRRTPDELRSDLVEPDETVEPRWWTMKITRSDGSIVEGLRMNEDTFTVRIMDGRENLRHFSKREIRASERVETSTMPAANDTLTDTEVDDLVAYLFSLRKEDGS